MKRCLNCDKAFEDEEWICPRCGYRPVWRDGIFRFVENPPSETAGYSPDAFARLARLEADHFWFCARNRLIQWILRQHFAPAQSILEIGCGTGFVLQGLQTARPELCLSGSELLSEGLLFARARLPDVKLYQMDARQIPFEEEFDVVGAFDVLEHVLEDETVLAQMFRATRAGGGLLLSVPQHRFLWSAADDHARHQRRYERGELRRKVQGAGYQVERITSFVSLLFPLMLLSRMAAKRGSESNPWAEFEISRPLNKLFKMILSLEHALIRAGFSFPVGGSLVLVARKSARPS